MSGSRTTAPPLLERFEALVCDLDGVVYAGPSAIPGAVEALTRAATTVRLQYATNNASRPVAQVAEHLTELGIATCPEQVLNSSVAAAALLQDLPRGSAVLAVGGQGVSTALRDVGLCPITPDELRASWTAPAAVVQGYGAQVRAEDLAAAAWAVQQGARWVATNTDRTLPTDRGLAPGNGTLVAAVGAAVEVDPEVAGKPEPLMYRLAADRLGLPPSAVLGVGDRLETDIAGARAAGLCSALVLTGVHGVADAAACAREQRPELLLESLTDLHCPYEPPVRDDQGGWRCGDSTADVRDGELLIAGGGVTLGRAILGAVWAAIDEGTVESHAAAQLVRSSVA